MKPTAVRTAFFGIPALLVTSAVLADGRLEGRISAGDSETYLEGARVRIESLNRSVSTTRDGRFSFGQVPPGAYTIAVEYLGAAPKRQQVRVTDGAVASVDIALGVSVDEIIVRGARSGTANALNKQRSSDTFVSVISSDDIGALPDSNVAEAVQRIPGVFLERDQGEGRFVGIRGIDPNLNNTTINGLLVPSPESGARSVALDVIPSDLLEGLEITKTFTPDMDASAVGGTVNVRSLSAFDRAGRSLSFNAESSYNQLVEEFSPKIAATYTDIFSVGSDTDNFGIAFAASWFDRDFGSDNIETDGGWPSDLETVAGDEFKGAEEIEQRSYTINRERVGLALNFDYRTDNGRYYWRNLYSEFSDQEFRTRNEYKFDDGDAILGSATSAQWQDAVVEKSLKDRLEEQTILSILLGGENEFDNWSADYSYGYSLSEEAEPNRLDTTFVVEDVDIGYDAVGETPALTAEGAVFGAAAYELDEFEFLDGETEDEAHSFKLNFTRGIFSDAYNGNVRFGVNYRIREKTNDEEVFVYGDPNSSSLAGFAAGAPRYDIGGFGPGIDDGAIKSFFFQNRDNLELDDDDTLVASIAGDYTIDEDVTAAFLMSTLETGNWRIVYGVRYESTDFSATGQRIVVDDVTGSGDPEPRPVAFDNDYDNWLPGINLRYEAGDVVWRAAATQTVARPSFGDLSPGGEVELEEDDGENELSAELGNPLLDPVESTNIDVGFEWYPGDVSAFSAGVFYKRIENFVVIADLGGVLDVTDLIGDVPVVDAEIIQPINGDKADLFGFELSGTKQFANGFFVSGNGTYIDSEATFPGRDAEGVLPRTPEYVVNGAVGWENELFYLRLAATYRDDALQGFEELDDPDFDVFQDAHTQVDFAAKWNITPELQLSFAAINVTDEPFYTYFGTRTFNAQFEEYGRSYTLGLRWTPY